jgi:hypothetical protein
LAKRFPDKTPNYWAKLRCTGEGPEFLRVGARIYYEESAVEAWLATKRRTSTSDPGPDAPQQEQPNTPPARSRHQRKKALRLRSPESCFDRGGPEPEAA